MLHVSLHLWKTAITQPRAPQIWFYFLCRWAGILALIWHHICNNCCDSHLNASKSLCKSCNMKVSLSVCWSLDLLTCVLSTSVVMHILSVYQIVLNYSNGQFAPFPALKQRSQSITLPYSWFWKARFSCQAIETSFLATIFVYETKDLWLSRLEQGTCKSGMYLYLYMLKFNWTGSRASPQSNYNSPKVVMCGCFYVVELLLHFSLIVEEASFGLVRHDLGLGQGHL